MCVTCGCGSDHVHIEGHEHDEHWHQHEDGTWHSHTHDHHDHQHTHHHDHQPAIGAVHEHGVSTARVIEIERGLLDKNNKIANANKNVFAQRGIFALNVVSSPGSGKTSLLVRTIQELQGELPCAVIEGDQQTDNDAKRIRETGAPAVQINTGKGCHLDARMVAQALQALPELNEALLMIENVGNLVCPAAFDLGEEHKVVLLSVTEGADKPLKYPDMFYASDLLIINKIDLLPYVDFDVEEAIRYAKQIQPKLEVIQVSATTGEGMQDWLAWLKQGAKKALEKKNAHESNLDFLKERITALEKELAQLKQSLV